MLHAFSSTNAVREAALEGLAACLADGAPLAGPFAWDGKTGSITGCLMRSAEPADWEARLGLPLWLAHVLDLTAGDLPPLQAIAHVRTVFEALPLGVDAGPWGSRLILALLDDAVTNTGTAADARLAGALASVHDLHRRVLAREHILSVEWKAARWLALAATDAFPGEETEHPMPVSDLPAAGVAACIEAAVWNPASGPTVPGVTSLTAAAGVMRQWMALEARKADSEFGWNEGEFEEIREKLGNMHRLYIEPNPNETRDVFLLLKEHDPAADARILAHIAFTNRYRETCLSRAAVILERCLGGAA